jgi:hypothetical protein
MTGFAKSGLLLQGFGASGGVAPLPGCKSGDGISGDDATGDAAAGDAAAAGTTTGWAKFGAG